jgi:uncharacterized protein
MERVTARFGYAFPAALAGVLSLVCAVRMAEAQPPPPALTVPVNDFAGILDDASTAALEDLSRRLLAATGDVVVVSTVPTVEPYADIREFAVKQFENRGRGIGGKDKDNGLLVVVAVKERKVWIEVGYGLEEFITDGFAGETSRDYMVPAFRQGNYGAGLTAGLSRLVARIAQGRGIQLDDLQEPEEPATIAFNPVVVFVLLFAFLLLVSMSQSRKRRRRYWGGSPWSGWNSGAGSFGGGFGGTGFGGGGFGGGFGGFGGGGSGGGGGGGSW